MTAGKDRLFVGLELVNAQADARYEQLCRTPIGARDETSAQE
jgi:hypothetical protein